MNTGGNVSPDPHGVPESLYLNGAYLPLVDGRIGVEDRGFQLGDGVYEVVKVVNGRLLWLEDHLQRLVWSLGQIRLQHALRGHALDRVLPRLVALSGVQQGTVYLQVTRGVAPRDFPFPDEVEPTVLAYTRPAEPPAPEAVLAGTTVHPVEDVRWARCDIKSTNLLAAVLAKQAARDAGADEALFVGPGGVVREGGSSNVFAVFAGRVWTHPADTHILNGITRRHVIDLCARMGVEVVERAFTLEGLEAADEFFLVSTARDVMPVVAVGGRPLAGGRPGPVTLALADALRAEVARLVGLPAPPSLLHG
ncbi:MAG: aminotransferase class IV [Actinobacteria bacterium]|nr:aminotransferase class IV [Actinomycetota bacterium]